MKNLLTQIKAKLSLPSPPIKQNCCVRRPWRESVEYGGEGREVAGKQYGSYLFTVTIP